MPPEHLRFGGGVADSTIHPLVAVYLLIAIVLILILPRRKAIVPFLIVFFTIPIGQVVVLGSLHFTALRILILAGLARRATSGLSSSERKNPGGFGTVDWLVVLWSVSAFIAFCLQFMESQALIKGLGVLLDTLGGYLVVRYLIPDGDTLRRTIKTLAAICLINGICMINEQISHFNVFGLLGGIPTEVTVRAGHIRSAGVMGCLYAGAFAGVLIPLFVWLWTERKSRMAALAGLVGATAMVVTSYSSTSWMALMGSILGLFFWSLRRQMRLIRWGFVMMLVALQLVMKAPVWALIARADLIGASSGYQRYVLVDMCIRHFGDWWLMGTPAYTTWTWGSWDTCNQFVNVAEQGGLLTLIFYVGIFVCCFGLIGNARKLVNGNRNQEWLLWCLGSTLFASVIAEFGINYVPQLLMGFFPLLACISMATFEIRQQALAISEPCDTEILVSAQGSASAYLPFRTRTLRHNIINAYHKHP